MKQIAIITGASSGFGCLFATKVSELFESIDEIYLIARREDKLNEISKILSKPSKVMVMDLADMDNVRKLIDTVRDEKVSVKMLINCAGYGIYEEFEKADTDKTIGMIDVNCKALTLITKGLLPYMSYNSRIINIASVAAFVPQKKFAVYAASKSYVLSFTRALNIELYGEKIYCTAVCPGPADTEFFDVALKESDTVPFYKKMFMSNAEKVVDKAIIDSINKKEVSVYSIPMKLTRLACKIIPHGWILKFLRYF